ncbi:MAG: Maf family protein [Coriobacteriia bacterium]|nr:Maf family protein [Coriobacteriia bacterium]
MSGGIIPRMTDHPPHIVLASASPRRRRLFAWLDLPFDSIAVDTPESLVSPLAANPPALAMSLAGEKMDAARDVVARDALILTFDTIVVLDSALLGKPADEDDARRMLRALSGRTHQVVTGCAISPAAGAPTETFAVVTDVRMRELSDSRITEWMACGEYAGCAGAYNIEGQVADVTADECYQNVAGIPLCHLAAALGNPELADCLPTPPHLPVCTCDTALGRSCRLGPRLAATDKGRAHR